MAITIHRDLTLHNIRVVDGDTLECWLEMYRRVRVKTRLRIKGVEGGEQITPQGRAAQARLQCWLHEREELDKWLIGDPGTVDQYGRIVCDVGFSNGETLVALMLRSGYWWTRSRSGAQSAPTPHHD